MSILVVGVNHRSGPLPLLERVTIAPEHLGKAVAGLAQRDNVREAVVLSTCNRTEVYVVAELFHGAYGDVRDLLCELGDLSVDELTPHLYSQHDTSAITHLFEVAAGLDSAVLGESEILGQVRSAWETAQHEGAARSTLNQLFRSALSTGKRARSETGIARGTASISHAAVEMITDVLGDLNGKRVLVVGAGSMGEGVAVALHRAGGADILVANRSADRGVLLAERVDGVAVGFDRLSEAIAASDVIVAGTGAEQTLLTRSLVDDARRNNTRPLYIVDIGVPRNVDPDVADLAGVACRTSTISATGPTAGCRIVPARPNACARSSVRKSRTISSTRPPGRQHRSSPRCTRPPTAFELVRSSVSRRASANSTNVNASRSTR